MLIPVTAALVGLDNPHATGWWETLGHCPRIGRRVVCQPNRPASEIPDGADAAYTTIPDMLATEDLGFGLVCGRNDQNPISAELLLAAGIPLIIEKPVARTAAEIARLQEVAVAHGVPWATAFMNRYLPIAREFKRAVVEGALGRIVSIEGRMITSTVHQRNPGHWLFDRDIAGGGILHWLAIHTIDLIRYLSDLEYCSVMANVATLSETDINVEDMAALSFCMDNGAVGTLHAGYVLGQRYGDIYLCLRGTAGDIAWKMWDYNERGHSIRIQSVASGFESTECKEITAVPKEAPGYGGQAGLQYVTDFIDSAVQGQPFVSDGEDARRAMELVEGAYASSASNVTIDLPRE